MMPGHPVQQPQYDGLATAPKIMIVMVLLRLVLAPQPPLVVLYKCSAGTSNMLVLLLLGLLFGHTMYAGDDDALKSMAFTAQISYSHEKQFRVIPIIIIVVLVVAYSRKVYREFISFLALVSQLPLGWGTGGPTVVTIRHRSIEICRDNTTNNNHIIFGEIRPESDVKTRLEDLKLKNHRQCVRCIFGGRIRRGPRIITNIFNGLLLRSRRPDLFCIHKKTSCCGILLCLMAVRKGINHTISIHFITSKWDGYGLSMNALSLLLNKCVWDYSGISCLWANQSL